ncbi:MAG: molybdenum cofactor guanylyltransferase [Deltaproteobacteria bacterium]|nr:molybdenum cofactor guanylyltransferase [Deltaproteobacteria bacterium]
MTGIILAGGQSSRMGFNKAFATFGGERLIDHATGIFRKLFNQTIIVTLAPLDYLDIDATVVTDIFPGAAALGGIYTGLFHAKEEKSFVLSCDMPFIQESFISYMIEASSRYDIVVPRRPDGLQPLHAIYSRRQLHSIERNIKAGNLKITSFYGSSNIRIIPPDIIDTFDSEGLMFMNINNRDDLVRSGGLPPVDRRGRNGASTPQR